MISEFLMPGTRIIARKTGYGVDAGQTYTVRGFMWNRHWRTREPDPHVLLREVTARNDEGREVGYPRDAFDPAVDCPHPSAPCGRSLPLPMGEGR